MSCSSPRPHHPAVLIDLRMLGIEGEMHLAFRDWPPFRHQQFDRALLGACLDDPEAPGIGDLDDIGRYAARSQAYEFRPHAQLQSLRMTMIGRGIDGLD